MTGYITHRLEGLEPDNLLAFMALLGLLRTLEEARPEWCPRASWTVDELRLRPSLRVPEAVDQAAIAEGAAEGVSALARRHDFGEVKNLKELSPEQAACRLRKAAQAADRDRYTADLWSSLVSDAATKPDGKEAEPTPLCLMFGQGHQHFLSRLASVPLQKTLRRGYGRKKTVVSEEECLSEALFSPWQRPDTTSSFRWDPHEDVRYALRARDPTDPKTKETTQHGANRLAAVGLSSLTVSPRRRADGVKLAVVGGDRIARGGFVFRWPIWRDPVSLSGIRALLGHPGLSDRDVRSALGVVEVRETRRISSGKFMNFTRAEAD